MMQDVTFHSASEYHCHILLCPLPSVLNSYLASDCGPSVLLSSLPTTLTPPRPTPIGRPFGMQSAELRVIVTEPKFLLRPEMVESLFVLWRLTHKQMCA